MEKVSNFETCDIAQKATELTVILRPGELRLSPWTRINGEGNNRLHEVVF